MTEVDKELGCVQAEALAQLVDAISDGYWDWKVQDNYEYMSPRFWEMFGYTPEEKPHCPSAWQDIIFEEDLSVTLANFQRHVDTLGEYPYTQEVRYRHKNGSTVNILRRGLVVEWDENKQPVRMVGTHTNISAFKCAEHELRSTLDFHRLLMNANTDLIFVKDAQYRIIDANNAFLTLYPNKTLDDILFTTTIEDYNEEEAAAFLVQDKKAFTEGLSEVSETILFPDGQKRTLLTKKMCFENRDGKPHILGVSRDITGLRTTERALLKANDELKEFAYRTSHDLRSPLVSSRRLLSIVLKHLSKGEIEQTQNHLTMIDNSLEQLETLVTDILCMTRLNHAEAPNTLINFAVLIEESLKKLAHMEGFSRVSFSIDLCQLTRPINTSITHLTHVLENLLSNSIKYQSFDKNDTCVSIVARVNNRYFEFSVSDNGIGIPACERGNVFTMFKRFHPKTAFGSGLGLYMVKKNVERLHGTITYTPLNKGSQFTVRIPISSK